MNSAASVGQWNERLASQPVVFDACIPQIMWETRRRRNKGEEGIVGRVLYPIMRKGGMAAGIATAFSPVKRLQMLSLADSLRSLGTILQDFEQSHARIRLVETSRDFDIATQNGQIALMIGFQGLPPVDQEVYYVGLLKRLGVRVLQATYNEKCEVGDGCAERGNGGLSHFGVMVVQEVNRQRMVMDLSHVGERTFYDVVEVSKAPVIASHSNARSLRDHFRCITDDQMRAIAQKGGVVGINAFAPQLAERGASVKHVLDHIEYVAKLIGADRVGIGLDLMYYTAAPDAYPDPYVPGDDQVPGLTDPAGIPSIAEGLSKRGFSDKDILGILGQNFLRVIRNVIDP